MTFVLSPILMVNGFLQMHIMDTLECGIDQVCGIVHRPCHLVDILTPINHMVHINQKILC